MKIGNLTLENSVFLAPMAGVTDLPFRVICKKFGAGLVYSEMVSSKAMHYNDKKTMGLLLTNADEAPLAVQIFGHEPEIMAESVPKALSTGAKLLDINMGCPAPKITGNGAGSALMKNTDLAAKIAETVVKNANGTPVSVKMRKGWDDDCITCVELAKKVEAAGVNFITVHGRTRKQMYTPGIDMDAIKNVKNAVSIPVIGNGDITKPEDVVNMMDYTGCDAVMIGREALSRPWIFKQVNQALNGLPIDREPTVEERMALLLWHIEKLCEVNGEVLGMKKARGQAALYMKGLRGAAHLRFLTNSLTVFEDAKNLVNEVLKENSNV